MQLVAKKSSKNLCFSYDISISIQLLAPNICPRAHHCNREDRWPRLPFCQGRLRQGLPVWQASNIFRRQLMAKRWVGSPNSKPANWSPNSLEPFFVSRKWKYDHFGEIVIDGCTGGCQNDYFHCSLPDSKDHRIDIDLGINRMVFAVWAVMNISSKWHFLFRVCWL